MKNDKQITNAVEEPPEAAQPEAKKPSLRRSLLAEVFEANTPTGQEAMRGGTLFKRKRVSFLVPRDSCTVDFPEDFEITLQEVSAADEMAATRDTNSGSEITMRLARASLHGLNGEPISSVHREWLWEALGMGGRMLVVWAFQTHLAPRGDEEGKAKIEKAVMEARIE